MGMTRGTILDGLQSREATAAEFGRSIRTVQRWERLGLPLIMVGTVRMHDPVSVREWLKSRERKQDLPRGGCGRGRGSPW